MQQLSVLYWAFGAYLCHLGAAPHPAFGHLLPVNGEKEEPLRTKRKRCFMPRMNVAARDSSFQPAYLARLNDEQRGAVMHGEGGVARAAADHRRRRVRQDQHARPPRRASDRQRRRSAPHPVDDLFAPRGGGDGAARRAHRRRGARPRRRGHPRRALLGRHLSRHRRQAAARLCAGDRARSGLHHPRPRGFGRPHEPRPPRARPFPHREPVSGQGHLPRHLFARRQCREAARRNPGQELSLVRRLGGRARAAVRGLCRGQAGAERARLRRSAALLGRHGGRAGAGRASRRAASTMCWSTNTRTPTGCRPRSCWR